MMFASKQSPRPGIGWGKWVSEVSEMLDASRIKNLKKERHQVILMEDLPCVRCIHIVFSINFFNSLMEKGFIFL